MVNHEIFYVPVKQVDGNREQSLEQPQGHDGFSEAPFLVSFLYLLNSSLSSSCPLHVLRAHSIRVERQ